MFTTSGIFIVPDGVNKIDIFVVGGGETGSLGYGKYSRNGGDGGNGGQTITKLNMSVTEGAAYSVIVGTGGAPSSFGNVLTALPGAVSRGSGGGAGGTNKEGEDDVGTTNAVYSAGDGGSNGAGGAATTPFYIDGDIHGVMRYGKAGQGTTTRAFGEASGTLYAGGGGGGRTDGVWKGGERWGTGGAGGGGTGGIGKYSAPNTPAGSGTPNTGGGGGGAFWAGSTNRAPDGIGGPGGSGVVIIRWYADRQ